MFTTPNLTELFGDDVIESDDFIDISKQAFQSVKLDFSLNHWIPIIVGVHELIKRTYVGYLYDNSGFVLEDGKSCIVYDYVSSYSDVKVINLGKRYESSYTIWGYLWLVVDSNIPNIDTSVNLFTIFDEFIRVNKQAIGNPTSLKSFLHGFIHYLFLLNHPSIKVDNNYYIEIYSNVNQTLKAENING